MLTGIAAVQDAADADERRAFLGGHAVVLARAHRELPQAKPFRQFPEAPEKRPRLLWVARERRHRRKPADFVGDLLKERLQLVRRDPGFRLLSREIDLHERRNLEAASRGLRVKRVKELADRVHGLGL